MSGQNYSIVEFFGSDGGHRCGYCKSEEGNHNQGMWAHEMTPRDYQDLIDRGWRRSGKYCYKPSMSVMCCPSYTIKCAVKDFKLSKSQKKNLKTFTKFLATGVTSKSGLREAVKEGHLENPFDEDAQPTLKMEGGGGGGGDLDAAMKSAGASAENIASSTSTASVKGASSKISVEATPAGEDLAGKKDAPAKGVGADPNKPKAVKAKLLRKKKRLAKSSGGGGGGGGVSTPTRNTSEPNDEASSCDELTSNLTLAPAEGEKKTLEELISESEKVPEPKVRFEVKLIKANPPSEEFQATFQESFRLYKKYQMTIHNDKEDKCTERQFSRFLCHSPLFPAESADPNLSFGSYHQHYYVDGCLIAVGVVDILPSCVSSVYLYYDPDFHFLTLGTFSALREIYFTRQLSKRIPSIESYYMGFYIHSCPKMRYKGAYQPSFLLCPEVNTWHEIESCKPKLDIERYQRFNEDSSAVDEGKFDGDLGKVKILHKGFPMSYEMFRRYKADADDENQVETFAQLIGASCTRILLYRQ